MEMKQTTSPFPNIIPPHNLQPPRPTMSSISPSSSSPSPSSSSALSATSHMRRQRRNAVSRAAESDWDAPSAHSPSPSDPLPRRDDELVCPLASSEVPPPSAQLCINVGGPADDNDDDLQAVLARFTFPTSARKHRRSGEIINNSVAPAAPTSDWRCSGSSVRRARCAHCERGLGSA